jgi:hypothetical protein
LKTLTLYWMVFKNFNLNLMHNNGKNSILTQQHSIKDT